jgi:hypothetical protein
MAPLQNLFNMVLCRLDFIEVSLVPVVFVYTTKNHHVRPMNVYIEISDTSSPTDDVYWNILQ